MSVKRFKKKQPRTKIVHRHTGKYRTRTPRGRTIYKRNPRHKHKLPKKHRKIFQQLDKEKFETGGYMDFDEKGLERADVYIGDEKSVDIEESPDKEVEYHTHPTTNIKYRKGLAFPSKSDIKTFKETPSQSMVVFSGGNAMVASKTDKFRVNKKRIDNLYKDLNKDAKEMGTNELFKKYKPEYGKMGLDLDYVKKNKPINLPISIVEPKYKPKKVQRKMFFRPVSRIVDEEYEELPEEEHEEGRFEKER